MVYVSVISFQSQIANNYYPDNVFIQGHKSSQRRQHGCLIVTMSRQRQRYTKNTNSMNRSCHPSRIHTRLWQDYQKKVLDFLYLDAHNGDENNDDNNNNNEKVKEYDFVQKSL